MADIFIVIDGVDDLLAKFANLIPIVNTAMLAGGEDVKGAIAQYPQQTHITRKSVYGTSFKTDRQRRWFFAVGIHQTPYQRTGQLGQGWNVQNPQPLTVVVGNQAPHAGYVQGGAQDNPPQSLYHKAQGWKTTDAVAEEKNEAVTQKVARAIEASI
jgi:hypothetical protein